MKKAGKLILLLLLTFLSKGFSQEEKCGFNYAQDYLRKIDPNYDAKLKLLDDITINQKPSSTQIYTVPVVFHVLHQGGTENISDTQIQSAVQILTRDFRKLNSDTSAIVTEFKALAADCEIEFVLASLDPDGNCTNGITRHFDANTNWEVDILNYNYTWPPNKYLNIYVVKNMQSNAAAYTFLPGTAPQIMDAVVTRHNYVGDIGTSSTYRSRTLTHEVGHWFGLSHVWGNSNNPGVACGDDGVNDTPITKGHSFCNLFNTIDCTPTVKENIQNYMEYAYCSNMFTIGQATRMQNVIINGTAGRDNLVSASNHSFTGVISPNYNCPPKAEFNSDASICAGTAYQFFDQSYNGVPTSWTWSAQGAVSTSTNQNGSLIFNTSGFKNVQLKAANSFGADSVIKNNAIAVLSSIAKPLNTAQDFESFVYPDTVWLTSTPQYGSGFKLNSNVGKSGSKSLYINNYLDNPNESVVLFTPPYNLNGFNFAELVFSYAYTQQSGNNDQLQIFVSTDCGANWQLAYNQSGAGLNTRAPINGVEFGTPSAEDWKEEHVALNSFLNNGNMHFKFVFTPDVNGPGNNFFIDDIFVNTTVGLEVENLNSNLLMVFPNPANNELRIRSNTKLNQIELFGIQGNKLATQINAKQSTQMEVDISTLPSGVYFVKATSGNTQTIRRFSVIK